jgi:SAM-dependent methyltransferase
MTAETSAWGRGYPVQLPYPPAWHPFVAPPHIAAICALMGVAWDVAPDRPMAIADIGCGTGYTAAVLAAGNPNAKVIGLDYNPAHIAEARALAAEARLPNLHFLEADLAEMAAAEIDGLPEFDLVAVHGLWSWVADPVREGLLRLLKRRVKPGGVVMLSYNALPGAGTALGLARLVRGALLAGGSPAEGLEAARALVKALGEAEAHHLLPSTWLRALTDQNTPRSEGYLLHEFLTAHWRPAFFADVAEALGAARLEHVGSATIAENFPQMSLTPPQQALWHAAPDAAARQLVMDLCVQRAFRRDVFVRGLRRVPAEAVTAGIVLATASLAPEDPDLITQAGKAALPPGLIRPIRAALAERPHAIGELLALPGCGSATPTELLCLLLGSGAALPLWRTPGSGAGWAEASDAARRLNAAAARRLAPHGKGLGHFALASPALGGGVAAEAMELAVMQLLAGAPDHAAQRALAADLPEVIRRLVPPGPLPPAPVREELTQVIGVMVAERLPVHQALGIL